VAGGLSLRTRFLDDGQLFNLDFTPIIHVFTHFLTAFSAYKTYVTIPPINIPSTSISSHHHLTLSPPINLILFIVFVFLPFWGKKRSIEG